MKRSPHRRFAYRLAREVAKTVHVDRMLRGMTAKQFLRWQTFYSIEPLGDEREDIRSAALRSLLYNVNVAFKDRKTLQDFMFAFTDEDLKAVDKRREELNWSAAQWIIAQSKAFAEVNAEREAQGLEPLTIRELKD